VATLVNKITKQSYLVGAEPNAMGWRLAEVNASTQLKRTEVKIMVGARSFPSATRDADGSGKKGLHALEDSDPEEITGHDEKGAYVRGVPYPERRRP